MVYSYVKTTHKNQNRRGYKFNIVKSNTTIDTIGAKKMFKSKVQRYNKQVKFSISNTKGLHTLILTQLNNGETSK